MSAEIKVPTMAEFAARGEMPDILFWVGCASSFDDRAKKITRSFAKILHHCRISFAVLGTEESCTGDPAKRAGNEFLYQMQALTNIQVLNGYGITRMVTACPHCFNILKNEYPELGGDAYSCTECGRCTDVCPANQTGKLLSPRKIMMDTRDRMEEVGKGIDKNGKDFKDEKTLLHNYILPEEIWACTTCQACVEACPVNIDPLHIIVQIRRYMVMEENTTTSELNMMFTKVENNGAPWQFSPSDRFNWADDLTVKKLPE